MHRERVALPYKNTGAKAPRSQLGGLRVVRVGPRLPSPKSVLRTTVTRRRTRKIRRPSPTNLQRPLLSGAAPIQGGKRRHSPDWSWLNGRGPDSPGCGWQLKTCRRRGCRSPACRSSPKTPFCLPDARRSNRLAAIFAQPERRSATYDMSGRCRPSHIFRR